MNNHTYNKLDDILQAEYKRGREEGYAARKEAEELFTQFADWLEEVKSLRCKLQECRRMIEALTRDDFNELFEVHLRKQKEEE